MNDNGDNQESRVSVLPTKSLAEFSSSEISAATEASACCSRPDPVTAHDGSRREALSFTAPCGHEPKYDQNESDSVDNCLKRKLLLLSNEDGLTSLESG